MNSLTTLEKLHLIVQKHHPLNNLTDDQLKEMGLKRNKKSYSLKEFIELYNKKITHK